MDQLWSTHHKQDFLFDNIRTLNNPRSLQNSQIPSNSSKTIEEIRLMTKFGYLQTAIFQYQDSFIRCKTVLNHHNGSTTSIKSISPYSKPINGLKPSSVCLLELLALFTYEFGYRSTKQVMFLVDFQYTSTNSD